MKYIEILSKVRENVKTFTLVFGELKVGTFEKITKTSVQFSDCSTEGNA